MDINGRPDSIEDYLVTVRTGQWFGWSDSSNKIYANLVVLDGGSKPTESDCTTGLAALQTAWDLENERTKYPWLMVSEGEAFFGDYGAIRKSYLVSL